MLAEQRYQKIISLMQTDGSVKDCGFKEEDGGFSRNSPQGFGKHGGSGTDTAYERRAFLADKEEMPGERTIQYQNFSARERENLESKVEIAEFAVRFIKEGQSIALDSGTTAYELARVIKRTFHSLTVVTNSIAILNELADAKGITLIATGGVYRLRRWRLCLTLQV